MLDDAEFQAMLQKVRDRDEGAAGELFRLFEPELKRIVRVRLTSPNLRRLLDSGDICQSVFCNFYLRLASGQFQLSSPADLLRLLGTMAFNRVHDQARHHGAQRRGGGGVAGVEPEILQQVPDAAQSPATQASYRDLYARTLGLLNEDERQLAELRGQGREWPEIATMRNESAEALRKRLNRALDRVARQLGLDEIDEP